MKEQILEPSKEFLISKQGVIESVIDQLKALQQIHHTRHRSVLNFQINILQVWVLILLNQKKQE